MKRLISMMALSGALAAPAVQADTVSTLLAEYTASGAGDFSASAGKQLWQRQQPGGDGTTRSCAVCHTDDPRQPGSHVTTGKPIEALAPSVNPARLQDRREIEKWFTRNCKWTLGRECSAQEKGNVLTFLVDS